MRFMMLVIPKAYENAKADFVPSQPWFQPPGSQLRRA